MADRYRGSRYDRGDETNRGMFGYEGEGYMHGGGRDVGYSRDRDRDRDRGGLYAGRYGDELAGFRGTGYLGGDYGQARTDRERGGWWDAEPERPNYRGRGPKNYQRSDDRIREDVCERLERDERVDASDVEVAVENGIVIMSGTVQDRDMKRRAEDLAESCGGVRDVQNQIRVAR
jgi:osmotically-inducible protein OsmY